MASEIAKKVAGTFIVDSVSTMDESVLLWATGQCRSGDLSEAVQQFCKAQDEILDPALVVVESVSTDCIQCRVPTKIYDHESTHTSLAEVRFKLNPATKAWKRC